MNNFDLLPIFLNDTVWVCCTMFFCSLIVYIGCLKIAASVKKNFRLTIQNEKEDSCTVKLKMHSSDGSHVDVANADSKFRKFIPVNFNYTK